MRMAIGSCEDTAVLLSDYADGELGGLRRLRLRLHLVACDRCRAVLASLQATVHSLRRLANDLPPAKPELTDLVLERIRAEEGGSHR